MKEGKKSPGGQGQAQGADSAAPPMAKEGSAAAHGGPHATGRVSCNYATFTLYYFTPPQGPCATGQDVLYLCLNTFHLLPLPCHPPS